MDTPVVLLTLGGMLVIGLGAAFGAASRGESVGPNYYAWFVLGLIWFVFGVGTAFFFKLPSYWGFAAMGLLFLVLGLSKKDQWRKPRRFSELSPEERRIKLVIYGIGMFLVIIGLAVFVLLWLRIM